MPKTVRAKLALCLCCGKKASITHISKTPFYRKSDSKKLPRAFCDECWDSNKVWRNNWAVEGSWSVRNNKKNKDSG